MSDRPSQSILRLSRVCLQTGIGSSLLLKDISFEVELGTKVAIVGASGAGKTSLLRLLNRLVSPTKGEIYFQDRPLNTFSPIELRRQIVLVAQEPKLLGMNVFDALKYPLQLQQLSESEIRVRVDTWTQMLRISSEWFDKTQLQLSLGQRQLVTIARALMMQPKILLLDEPTSALDIATATHLLKILERQNQTQNQTIIMVNHQLGLVEEFGDRFLLLDRGRLIEDTKDGKIDWQTLQQKIMRSQTEQEREWE